MAKFPLQTTVASEQRQDTFSRIFGVWAAVLSCSTILLLAALLARSLQ
jgi:hypothetical protein